MPTYHYNDWTSPLILDDTLQETHVTYGKKEFVVLTMILSYEMLSVEAI